MFRTLWALLVFCFATLLCGTPSIFVHLVRPRSNFVIRAGALWSRMMLSATGARVEYVDLARASQQLPCLYLCNHLSNVDIWAMLSAVPETTRFVAKASLFRIPVMGQAMKASGFVPIDRKNRHAAMRSLEVAAQRVRDGTSVLMFVEGTRSMDGKLAPFKKGPFHLALEARVPVVPVAISGSWDVMRPRSLRLRPGPVRVRFMPPIDTTGYAADDIEGLQRDTRRAIVSGLDDPGEEPRDEVLEAAR
ncbi:MAG: 1-acyl-sn-glycerol-3-phosphate acyltransferase [bacterium]|nr:1-acyl-sn-glycerol-3-phosphate acyltransferase [bacterium]